MTRQKLWAAYETIKPDDLAKERMLNHILSAASENSPRGKEVPVRRKHVRRVLCVAAILLVSCALMVAAYATGFFNLWNIRLDQQDHFLNDEAVNGQTMDDEASQGLKKKAEFISMQGLEKSPEYKACSKWMEFVSHYDLNGNILRSVGNAPTGLPDEYIAYNCYTREMADKVDEICQTYHLSLLGESTVVADHETLFSQAGTGHICGGQTEESDQVTYMGYYYQGGTFAFDGQTTLISPFAAWNYPVDYQFRRTMKGSFDTVTLNVGDLNEYDQWQYTTKNGVNLLLAHSNSKALIIADRAKSFVVVNILNPSIGDIVYGELCMGRAGLEAIAETFDFSVIP